MHVLATAAEPSVRLMTLDPGHFQAALIQKEVMSGRNRDKIDRLEYLKAPRSMPAWEKANMLAKYAVTTRGTGLSRREGVGERPAAEPGRRSPGDPGGSR
jgi:hypothetical protein